jgi:hypothetical protein
LLRFWLISSVKYKWQWGVHFLGSVFKFFINEIHKFHYSFLIFKEALRKNVCSNSIYKNENVITIWFNRFNSTPFVFIAIVLSFFFPSNDPDRAILSWGWWHHRQTAKAPIDLRILGGFANKGDGSVDGFENWFQITRIGNWLPRKYEKQTLRL